MTTDKKDELGPVAKLRQRYFERRNTPKLTEEQKEALRKYKEEKEKQKKEPVRKIARNTDQGVDL